MNTPNFPTSSSPLNPAAPFDLAKILNNSPYGVGDPNDRTLEEVENRVIVGRMVRERLDAGACAQTMKIFKDCVTNKVNCQKQGSEFIKCLTTGFKDKSLVAECREEYLNKRAEFRRINGPRKE